MTQDLVVYRNVQSGDKVRKLKVGHSSVDIEWICEGELTPTTVLFRKKDYYVNIWDKFKDYKIYSLKDIVEYANSINSIVVKKVNRILKFEEK